MDKKTIMKKLNKIPDEQPIFFNGFKHGLKAENVLTVIKFKSRRYFLIKWENVNKATLVKTNYANCNCPLLVIRFYEGIIKWKNKS